MENTKVFDVNTKLGFGLMRLPKTDEKTIDFEQVCQMIDKFMEQGGTYFDTAYVYHEGCSETIVKEALVNRHPRESFTLATKLPAWEMKAKEDVQRIFEEQLERTGAGYFDYYLLHSIEKAHLPVYEKYDCFNWILEMKEKGLIKHAGFSFHDTPELLDEILTKYPKMEFVQLQINYLDWENNIVQSRACYEVAVKHNVPVIIMEPVKGGALAKLPEEAGKILKEANADVSEASWAMRFCASLDKVEVVLSGMSDMSQMDDNLKTMVDFRPLSCEENKVVKSVADLMLSMPIVQCTGCRYCVAGCPVGILIPDLIRCLNNTRLYGENPNAKNFYNRFTTEGGKASACLECGQCDGVCPQHLKVAEIIKEIAEVFDAE